MATKTNLYPTVAILTVAVFLLMTFWRNNVPSSPYTYEAEPPRAETMPKANVSSQAQTPEPVTVTVTVTAEAPLPTFDLEEETKKLAALRMPTEQAPINAQKDDNLTPPKPRYIFLDLGANGADSLETFLQNPSAKFKYEFPAPSWAKHSEAEIFLFEANPVFNDALVRAKQHHAALGTSVTIFPSTVVDTKDGVRTFYLDSVNAADGFWGSSTYDSHPDAVASGGKGTELSAVNLSRWLLMNTLPHDFVVVKMDIEGAEYQVLPHMAEMAVWSVVDHLFVEWHDNLPTDEDRQAAIRGIEKLKAEGVNCPHYDSAT